MLLPEAVRLDEVVIESAPDAPDAPLADRTVSVTGMLNGAGRLGVVFAVTVPLELAVTPELIVIVPV